MLTGSRVRVALLLSLLAPEVVSCQRMTPGAPANGDDASTTAAASVGWAGYNNGYDGQRFAALDQINVIGDALFLTTLHTTVSMNSTTCAVNWRQVDASEQQDPTSVNRGVAYLDGRLYRGMPGARLAALDAAANVAAYVMTLRKES